MKVKEREDMHSAKKAFQEEMMVSKRHHLRNYLIHFQIYDFIEQSHNLLNHCIPE